MLSIAVVEIGNICIASRFSARRINDRGASYLLLRNMSSTSLAASPLRIRKCNVLNRRPPRRERLRLHVRGDFPPAHDASRDATATHLRFSMLDSEWPARKAAYERWLAPDNFDGEGRQSAKLSGLDAEGDTNDADDRRKARPFRRAACGSGLFCHSQSVRHWLGQISRVARLSRRSPAPAPAWPSPRARAMARSTGPSC